jgi:hypothetical protein
MKKLILSAFVVASLVGVAQAQDSEFKPAAGDWTVEGVFNPTTGIIGNPFGIQYLRGRYFTSPTMAFRTGLNLQLNSGTATSVNVKNSTGAVVDLESSYSVFSIDLRPGIEKHFAGTERLSPYIGGELAIGFTSARAETQTLGGATPDAVVTDKVTGTNDFSFVGTSYFANDPAPVAGGLNLGLNFVVGADYYIAKHVYLGLEILFGVNYVAASDIEVTPGYLPTGATAPDPIKGESSLQLTPFTTSAGFRLGWKF